ncbi:MAG TPA: biotin/lipoyl-containing protein [Pseudomonas sp.]|uniref:acetyl-CoA carboxylase biotin carboxyl carrier protein n=1 Tax=Pseudomonas sp. TaxID=306 RepID=UPI002ED8593C
MDKTLIEQLVGLLETSSLREIEHVSQGERIRLVKAEGHAKSRKQPDPAPVPHESAPVTSPVATPSLHRVEASLVGLFYRASGPDQPPFVQVGDRVEEGQVLCIVEAMKMLNQIEAGCAGRVVRIACEDGSAVEPGTLLFELEPLEANDV